MPTVNYSDTAKADLADIFEHIVEHDAAAAEALVRMIVATCDTLAETTLMGRVRPDLPGSLRSFPKGNYVIFYREIPNGIEVARILHGARDIRHLF